MSPEDLLQCESNAPVLCVDGRLGLLIRFWGDEAGVQVPGESDIRTIPVARLHHASGGAIVERES